MSHDTLSLQNKVALVTGSGRENGIGAAIARTLARNGASVAIHYVSDSSKPRAEKVARDITQEFGTKTTVVQGGVESYETAERIVKEILKAFSVDHIDILGMLRRRGQFHQVAGRADQNLFSQQRSRRTQYTSS